MVTALLLIEKQPPPSTCTSVLRYTRGSSWADGGRVFVFKVQTIFIRFVFFFVFSKVIQSAVGESPIELLFLRVYRKHLLKRKQSDSDGLKDI